MPWLLSTGTKISGEPGELTTNGPNSKSSDHVTREKSYKQALVSGKLTTATGTAMVTTLFDLS